MADKVNYYFEPSVVWCNPSYKSIELTLNKIKIFVLKTTNLSVCLIAEAAEQVLIKFVIGVYRKSYLTNLSLDSNCPGYVLSLGEIRLKERERERVFKDADSC